MSSSPRRARFQIHLSTAIVMMFAAGGMLAANFRWMTPGPIRGYGFPFPFYMRLAEVSGHAARYLPDGDVIYHVHNAYIKVGPFNFEFSEGGWNYALLAFDAFVFLAAVSIVWAICEWWIRRRAQHKET